VFAQFHAVGAVASTAAWRHQLAGKSANVMMWPAAIEVELSFDTMRKRLSRVIVILYQTSSAISYTGRVRH
jgi:hypothetical protein